MGKVGIKYSKTNIYKNRTVFQGDKLEIFLDIFRSRQNFCGMEGFDIRERSRHRGL